MSAARYAWINGTLAPEGGAVSASSPGFLVGYGVFETLVDRGSGPVALERHAQRLAHGCGIMGLPAPKAEDLCAAFAALMKVNGETTARLRFTVARGVVEPLFIATSSPLPQWPAHEQLHRVPWKRNVDSPLAGVKCTSYADNIIALEAAKNKGAGEAIFTNTRDELCEGATSNLFLVRNGEVFTPPLSSGCLPGVTRALVIEACRAAGIVLHDDGALHVRDLEHADEVFITSSTRDVQPVSAVDGLTFAPGRVTSAVAAAYAAYPKG